MKINESQPAKTYDINILSSALGRCYNDDLTEKDKEDITELVEDALELLALEKPLVPHSDPVLIQKYLLQLERLYEISGSQKVKSALGESLSNTVRRKMNEHIADVKQIKINSQFFCSPEDIEKMFGIKDLWGNAYGIAMNELKEKNSQTAHPETPSGLLIPARKDQTRRLIEYVIGEIFQMDISLPLAGYISADLEGRHLLWTTQEERISYITPASYDLATQFSFEIPHNAAHIAHLSQQKPLGVRTYVDDMAHRSYFESIAVLAEHQIIDVLQKDPKRTAENLQACLDEKTGLTPDEFANWLTSDRVFEVRLRVARLLADYFTLEGLPFERVVDEVTKKTGLRREESLNETLKYYTLTGLGSVYVLGPKRLIKNNVSNPKNAILDKDGKVIRTWEEFNQQAV